MILLGIKDSNVGYTIVYVIVVVIALALLLPVLVGGDFSMANILALVLAISRHLQLRL
jgi:hypothetical protein